MIFDYIISIAGLVLQFAGVVISGVTLYITIHHGNRRDK